MYFTEYKKLAARGNMELNTLAARIEELKKEGRTNEWTGEQIAAKTKAAKAKLNQVQTDRRMQLLLDQAKAREITREQPYSERAYHLQKAATLAQGLEGEQLISLYEDLLKDPESRANKSEYEQLFRTRLYDPAHRLTFDELAQANYTPEEREQHKDRKALKALEAHLQTLQGIEEDAVEKLASGERPPDDLAVLFQAMLENVQHQREGGPSSEYKANLEYKTEAGAEGEGNAI